MPDEMFFSKDEKSLIRGSRVAPRTSTCRPCVLTLRDQPETEIPGVIMDINPHGMLVRLMETIPIGQAVMIQMMRDDKYQRKLSTPHKGQVRRVEGTVEGFFDHGIKLAPEKIRQASERPVHIPNKSAQAPRAPHPSRMHTLDSKRRR